VKVGFDSSQNDYSVVNTNKQEFWEQGLYLDPIDAPSCQAWYELIVYCCKDFLARVVASFGPRIASGATSEHLILRNFFQGSIHSDPLAAAWLYSCAPTTPLPRVFYHLCEEKMPLLLPHTFVFNSLPSCF